jgi:ABC-type antimicrobial peptide transport system permease subunit
MISIEAILYGLIGGLVGLKFFLLGLAAILFVYTLRDCTRQGKTVPVRAPARPPGPNLHA